MRIWNGRMLVGQEVRKHIQCLDLDVLFGYLVQPFFIYLFLRFQISLEAASFDLHLGLRNIFYDSSIKRY